MPWILGVAIQVTNEWFLINLKISLAGVKNFFYICSPFK